MKHHNIPITVHTHAPRASASRLTEYRLKRAAAMRDQAIDAAHDRYFEEVRAIGATDRKCTVDLRAGVAANVICWPFEPASDFPTPALIDPFGHALNFTAMQEGCTPAALLARNFYRRTNGAPR